MDILTQAMEESGLTLVLLLVGSLFLYFTRTKEKKNNNDNDRDGGFM